MFRHSEAEIIAIIAKALRSGNTFQVKGWPSLGEISMYPMKETDERLSALINYLGLEEEHMQRDTITFKKRKVKQND